MPTPKDYRFRKGDVLAITGVVEYSQHAGSRYVFIIPEPGMPSVGFDPKQVDHVVSFSLEPEDRVVYTKHDDEEFGTVVHVNGDFAWVTLDGGVDRLIDLKHLQRVDGTDEPEESTCEEVKRATARDYLKPVSNDDLSQARLCETGGQVA